MSLADPAGGAVTAYSPDVRLRRLTPALYAATLFVSALLLFAIQPMFTKLVLPRLGGAPAVWSVAMVFFQAALLVGYAYAHVVTRILPPAGSSLVHLGLIALAATTLPIAIAQGFAAPPATGIELWLFALFAASIGLPFVVLAASAPLMQSWFAASGHPMAGNPYVLYAASNLGSFAALLGYPFLLEPLLTLRAQTLGWALGYAALSLLVAAAALCASRAGAAAAPCQAVAGDEAPSIAERLTWTALAAIPAGLMVALTAFITTDVAAAPFLWVLPLALFLLTFVAIFRDRPWLAQRKVLLLLPFAATAMAATASGPLQSYWLTCILVHLIGFTVLTLACHGELYRRRPAPARLTTFYLWTSVGGVIGGGFAGLFAPHAFNGTFEYPILITAALLVVPGMFAGGWQPFLRQASPGLVLAAAAAVLILLGIPLPGNGTLPLMIAVIILFGVMLLQRRNPARFFGLAVFAFVVAQMQSSHSHIEQVRSFFGVHRVAENDAGTHRLLFHGTTLHGAERVRERNGAPVIGKPEPLTYYHAGGPLAEAIVATRQARGALGHIAAVGLGTGSLACYREPGEFWTFFEIDPQVIRIARDPRLFRFLSTCAPQLPIVLGDARLTLAASAAQYDLIVLDAFSSDAIPVHLLTREAFAGYLSRLAPRGIIVVHVSNRHMALEHRIAAVGAAEGLVTYGKRVAADNFAVDYRAASEVVVLARDIADLAPLSEPSGWTRIDPDPRSPAWTDDYADVLGAILDKKFGR